jgi:glycine hydroxymethyltransferase
MECLGSCLTNKYAEGYPGKRYYGGNEYVDQVEQMCMDRALAAYNLDPAKWGVNVQPYSGSPANFAVYTALLRPHDRIMGLDLPSGGHLTHGFYTYSKAENTRKAVSATSVYFESLPYRVNPQTGIIDYDALQSQASLFKPALIICGGSAYPRDWDYARYRAIADENGSLLMMDMAHISGLVATGEAANPFDVCDIVTTTTHKSLRGPRAGMIFYRKDERNFETKIANAVFPGLQGGPHMHQVAGIATQLKEVNTPAFKEYARQIRKNAQACADQLTKVHGYTLATGGTENHLLLWDLKPQGLNGARMQTVCDNCSITLNVRPPSLSRHDDFNALRLFTTQKNTVPGDRSALSPGGVRIGAPALTTRGLDEIAFRKVADFLHRAAQIAVSIQDSGAKTPKDFEAAVKVSAEVKSLKLDVMQFITQYPMPGFDTATMMYKHVSV